MYINATYICGESEESLEDAKQQLLREIAAYYAKEAAATLAALTTAGASDSAE
jgi:hypothetical protein